MNYSAFKFFLFLSAAVLLPALLHAQPSVCFESKCFHPDIAATAEEKQTGLMNRESLPDTGGMLFVYERPIRPVFWMKNMRIPLDFVWIDEDGKVADLHENIPPCGKECPSIVSEEAVNYVLEIAAGSIAKYGIQIGDTAVIKEI